MSVLEKQIYLFRIKDKPHANRKHGIEKRSHLTQVREGLSLSDSKSYHNQDE